MLGTLINLFNGKKYNVMRQRVDCNNFSIQEFYIGVLIVALIIFLLPTLAMYYFISFIQVVIVVLAYQIFLIILQILLFHFPTYLIVHAANYPYSIPDSIHIEISSNYRNHMRIIQKQSNKGSIFENLKSELQKIPKAASPANVIKSIIYGDNILKLMRDILQILSI